ncbi:alpha carbonic anhydrase 7-like [Dioscorea cayenensis subsp. rotundata]|uniref:Alpha carbonic anhydrase 7-like n=1 Tax=Dioscorea cayennensis subsp. rotundata TaxID=55577 RepID=A0AB40C7Z9_DIOCR|nr:alpha carbonic anhydrase 7-like [Dioscorea cayenensis subsp. rotundata]
MPFPTYMNTQLTEPNVQWMMINFSTLFFFIFFLVLQVASGGNEEWKTCREGSEQSPVDVNHKLMQIEKRNGSLITSYGSSDATMKNNGYEVILQWMNGTAGHLLIEGKKFMLQQCHWHSPSEHTFNGQRYPLEMHMVHSSSEGEIAIIGVVYELGAADIFLSPKVMRNVKYLKDKQQDEVLMGSMLPPLIERTTPYYRYLGSLTTPPCSEGVVWSLVHDVQTVSLEQVKLIRAAINNINNARKIQPINGRSIYLYEPEMDEEHRDFK